MKRLFPIFTFLVACFFVTGCASMVSPGSEEIEVAGKQEARCLVINCYTKKIIANISVPGKTLLKKSHEGGRPACYNLIVFKRGYKPRGFLVRVGFNWFAIVDIVWGGLSPAVLAYDKHTGAAYTLPDRIDYGELDSAKGHKIFDEPTMEFRFPFIIQRELEKRKAKQAVEK